MKDSRRGYMRLLIVVLGPWIAYEVLEATKRGQANDGERDADNDRRREEVSIGFMARFDSEEYMSVLKTYD